MNSARFYDGKQGIPHQGSILITSAGLEMQLEDARVAWRFSAIRILGNPMDGLPIRLTCDHAPDARIEIHDAATWQAIRGHLKKHQRQGFYVPISSPLLIGLCITSLALLLVMYKGFVWFPQHIAPLLPHSVKAKFSNMAMDELFPDAALCQSDAGTAALQQLQTKLTLAAGIEYPARFSVLRQDMVNAFALPDGRIVVSSGLIKQAEHPDEVAGVLAHELGHVIEDHAAQGLVRVLGMEFVFLLMLGQGTDHIDPQTLLQALLYTSSSREAERAADRIGISILQKSGITVHGLRTFFTKQQKKEKGVASMLTYISTHPSTAERLSDLATAKDNAPAPLKSSLNLPQWQALQAICD